MKQTAVEWFAEKVGHNSLISLVEYNELLEQAKELEKQQIEKAFEEGMFHHTSGLCPDEYYEETFKSE